jgi:hypothetical protein
MQSCCLVPAVYGWPVECESNLVNSLDAVDGQNRTFCCQETNFRQADSMLPGPAQLPESFDVACLLTVSAVGCATSSHQR